MEKIIRHVPLTRVEERILKALLLTYATEKIKKAQEGGLRHLDDADLKWMTTMIGEVCEAIRLTRGVGQSEQWESIFQIAHKVISDRISQSFERTMAEKTVNKALSKGCSKLTLDKGTGSVCWIYWGAIPQTTTVSSVYQQEE